MANPKILNDYRSLSNFCTFTDLQHIASYLLILCIYSIFCALSDTWATLVIWGFPICPYYTVRAYVLHTVSKRRHESQGVAVYHGTCQHHDDAELLRSCNLRFCKGRNGASGGVVQSVVLLPPYYFWVQNYAEKHQDMPSISQYDKWRKSLKIQDLSPFAEI